MVDIAHNVEAWYRQLVVLDLLEKYDVESMGSHKRAECVNLCFVCDRVDVNSGNVVTDQIHFYAVVFDLTSFSWRIFLLRSRRLLLDDVEPSDSCSSARCTL